jgi:hypothetical protein
MSCGDYNNPFGYNNAYGYACRDDVPYPQVSHESVPSLIDNLVGALYGAFYNPQTQQGFITKSVVNGRIVWNIPCDPNNTGTINNIDRYPGEGLLCYIMRSLNLTITSNGFVTVNGVQTLQNKTLDATCSLAGNAATATNSTTTNGVKALNSSPSSPTAGQIYYDTTTNHFFGWNGSTWKQLDN